MADSSELDLRKAERKRKVERLRASHNMTHDGRVWQVTPRSQRMISAAAFQASRVTEASPWPTDFTWIDNDNNEVTLTAAQVLALEKAMFDRLYGRRLRARALKDAIDEAVDVGAVDAIDITTGWPS